MKQHVTAQSAIVIKIMNDDKQQGSACLFYLNEKGRLNNFI